MSIAAKTSDTAARKRTTLADVARAVGVTPMTVHNVLNQKGGFSDEVRARVLQAARALDYRSNLLASSLKTGRSHGIGILLHKMSFVGSCQLAGAAAAARAAGYHLIVSVHESDAFDAIAMLEEMRDRQLDGVVSLSSLTNFRSNVARHLPQLQLPFVFGFHAPPLAQGENSVADSVLIDQSGGAQLAANHLLKQGRKRLLFLGVENNLASQQRLAGVRAAHRDLGLEWSDERVLLAPDWHNSQALQTLRAEFDKGSHGVDGIVAASDMLAAGALQFLSERGIRVPDDIAVVGFDDDRMAGAFSPPLTTVSMPLHHLGKVCVERLLSRLDNPDDWQPETIRLPCQLVVRQSCGAQLPDASASQPAPTSVPNFPKP